MTGRFRKALSKSPRTPRVTAKEHLLLLGVDPNHPTGVVEVFAPVSGTITDQQITNQSGVQALSAPNPFTISDLSKVWIICDVYENNMSQVHLGEYADIHLVAYPNRVLKGRIGNILPIVDPNIRTAKVRLEVDNPASCASACLSPRRLRGSRRSVTRACPPRRSSSARSPMGLHAGREWTLSAPGGDRRGDAAGRHAGNHQRHQAGRQGYFKCLGFPKHGGTVNDPQAGRFRAR